MRWLCAGRTGLVAVLFCSNTNQKEPMTARSDPFPHDWNAVTSFDDIPRGEPVVVLYADGKARVVRGFMHVAEHRVRYWRYATRSTD